MFGSASLHGQFQKPANTKQFFKPLTTGEPQGIAGLVLDEIVGPDAGDVSATLRRRAR